MQNPPRGARKCAPSSVQRLVADGPHVPVRDAHALHVRAHIVLDAVLLEERLDAVADLRVVVLREREEKKEGGRRHEQSAE